MEQKTKEKYTICISRYYLKATKVSKRDDI